MATLTGKTGGDRGREVALKDGSPCGVGGVPAVPGPRCVPGPPGFPARGASGRVAATPPSPSERSAAAGPNYRFLRGGGGGALRLVAPARVRVLSEPGRRATGGWENPTAHRRTRQSRSLTDPQPRARALGHRSGPPPPRRVAQSAERRGGLKAQAVHSAPLRGREPCTEGGATSHWGGAKAQASVEEPTSSQQTDSAAQAEFILSFLLQAPREWEKMFVFS